MRGNALELGDRLRLNVNRLVLKVNPLSKAGQFFVHDRVHKLDFGGNNAKASRTS